MNQNKFNMDYIPDKVKSEAFDAMYKEIEKENGPDSYNYVPEEEYDNVYNKILAEKIAANSKDKFDYLDYTADPKLQHQEINNGINKISLLKEDPVDPRDLNETEETIANEQALRFIERTEPELMQSDVYESDDPVAKARYSNILDYFRKRNSGFYEKQDAARKAAEIKYNGREFDRFGRDTPILQDVSRPGAIVEELSKINRNRGANRNGLGTSQLLNNFRR